MNNRILIVVGGGLLAVVGLGFWIFTSRLQSATLNLVVVPNDATVVVDGDKTTKPGQIKLSPGAHRLNIKRTGFAGQIITISVKSGQNLEKKLILSPNSEEGRRWLAEHPDQMRVGDGIRGEEIQDATTALKERYPLTGKLPYSSRYFKVYAGPSRQYPNDSTRIAIYITIGNDSYKDDALQWIRSKGYDPDDYEIIYVRP